MPFKGFLQFLWKMHSHLIVSNIAILSDTGFTKRQTRRPLAYMLWCNGLGNRPRKKWSLFKGCKLSEANSFPARPRDSSSCQILGTLCFVFFYTPCYTLITFALTCFLVSLKHWHVTVVYVWQVGTDTLVSLIINKTKQCVTAGMPMDTLWALVRCSSFDKLSVLTVPGNAKNFFRIWIKFMDLWVFINQFYQISNWVPVSGYCFHPMRTLPRWLVC